MTPGTSLRLPPRQKAEHHLHRDIAMQIAIWIIVILIIAALIKYLLGESGKK